MIRTTWRRFWRDEEGATAIEYALAASVIAVVCVVGFLALGNSVRTMYESNQSNIVAALN